MTDKELIELAAKVVGAEAGKDWNPLADDGDAFRLAVNLNILLFVTGGTHARNAMGWPPDSYGAARRAIVCAAAEAERRLSERAK